jgi:DNA-binding NarL/FixJ family response regulator
MNPTPNSASVALVEDIPDVRETWRRLINRCPGLACVCACASGEEALHIIPPLRPSVVLMDIYLPKMSGIECATRLKLLLPETKILILTSALDGDLVFQALEGGADGYLLKRTSPAELRAAIFESLSGGAPMTSEIARRVVAYFRKRGVARDAALRLTPREEEVLGLVAKGYANKEIADKLAVTYETIRDHLKKVYNKLHVHSRTEAAARYFGASARDNHF